MSTEREYEAGTELDPEAEAFVEKGAAEEAPPPEPKKERAPREPDFDASAKKETAEPDPIESRARLMGWVPPEEFRGDGGRKPLTAQEFVDRANPAILHERMEKMAKENEATVARLERMNQAALDKQRGDYEARLLELKKQRDKEVIQVARTNGEEAAEEHAQKWDAYIDKQKPQAPQQQAEDPAMVSARSGWIASRPEFQTNRRFAAAAIAELDAILADHPNYDYAQQFSELDKRLEPDFPGVYRKEKPTANGAPPPDSRQMDGVRISAKKGTNYASRLNNAEKIQGARFVKQGVFPDLETYAKEVYNDE